MSDWRSHDASQDFKQKRKRELDSGTAVAYGHRFDPTKHEREQEVRDEHGRRRLHGAFTGGFSAGYFGTVGSKEGWSPSTLGSSRSKRAKATSNVMDYMDAEDIADLEETMDMKAARETKRRALLQADDAAEPASEAPQGTPVPARKIQSKVGGMSTLAQMDDDEDVDGFDIGPKIAYSKTREKQKKIKTTATVSHTFKSSKDVQAKTAKQQVLLEEMEGATVVENIKDKMHEPEPAGPVSIHPARVALPAESNEAKQDLSPSEEQIPPWRRKAIQTSELSKDHATGPSLDTRLAKAALKSTFNPYAQDAQKSQRYQAYLTLEAAESTPHHDNRAHLESDVFSAELTEFHRAALMFGSSAGAMAQRFTSATGRAETASVSAPVTVMADQVEAARLGLFGHRTRVVEPWFPTRLLCKRFGVADPHPEGKAAYQQQQEGRVDDHIEQRAQIEALMRSEPVVQQGSAHKPASTPTKPISRTEPARTSAAFEQIFGNDSD